MRDELLNTQIFYSLAAAQQRLEDWRVDYNSKRPHGALGNCTPEEFAAREFNLTVVQI